MFEGQGIRGREYLSGLNWFTEKTLTDIPNKVLGFPGGSDGKEFACNAGSPGLIPGSGRYLGEGNGYPLWYSFLENSMDRGVWWATVHGGHKESDMSEHTYI